jgi:hypothetical protein
MDKVRPNRAFFSLHAFMLAADAMNEYIDRQGVKKSSTMQHIALFGTTVANAEAWASTYVLQELCIPLCGLLPCQGCLKLLDVASPMGMRWPSLPTPVESL